MVSKTVSLLALASMAVAELPPIHIKGTKFFYENGTQFFMKGVAYQPEVGVGGKSTSTKVEYIDPLADEVTCKRDIPLLKELGTNTIRTYAIDPKADHSACMKMLDDAGIYVISDLSQPELSIKRDAPLWNVPLYNRYTGVVDEMAKYSNTIGFFAGNEVSDASNNTEASAFVKAALRDTKKHIADKGYRPLGVGYASNDHPDIRNEIAQYFNCGTDEEATDYWGYNIYSWCGESSMQKSGYNDQVKFFKDYNVPVFFAEYGCNVPDGAEGRIFQETGALYSNEMTDVFSGGIVYMYHQEANDYGLVQVKNGKATKMKNFDALKREHKKADPKGVDEDSYKPAGERSKCPEITDIWRANSILPPTPDESLCECMVAASECAPTKNLKSSDYGDIFGFICGAKPELCVGMGGNATTGVYGAYSMCSDDQKLAFVLDAYYKEQKGAADSCDFNGAAAVKKASAASTCTEPLKNAAIFNKEAASGNARGNSNKDDKSAAISIHGAAMGLYMLVAGAGAAMLVL